MPLVPCYRGSVNAWECDENDHLNVRFFLAKANQGLPFVLEALGARTALDEQGARPRIRVQHVRFLREARLAAPLTAYAGLATTSGNELTIYSEVRHSLTGEVMATLLTGIDFAGAPRALPALRDGLRCTVPEHGVPRGIRPDGEPLRPEQAS